jgi:hypothetical protein
VEKLKSNSNKLFCILLLATVAVAQSSWNGGATGRGAVQVVTSASSGPPPVAILTTSLADGQELQPYSQTLNATGGSGVYSWTETGALPPGLSLDASSGAITGTPAAGSSNLYTITVTVTDTSSPPQQISKGLSINITPAPPPPLGITTPGPALPAAFVGQPYPFTFNAQGGQPPYLWSNTGSLPAGITLNKNTGAISGSPTSSGTSNFTMKVTDALGASATANYSITVNPNSAVTLTWNIVSSAFGYRVYRSQTSGSGFQQIADTTITTYIDAAVTPGQTYFYVVTSYNNNGESSFSNQATVTIPGGTLPGYCNPPGYCARTDTLTVQQKSPPPNMGGLTGANTVITDTNFHTIISRCTDANSISGHANIGVLTIDNNDSPKINLDSTLLMVTITGQISYLISIDPYPVLSNGSANPDYMHCHPTPIGGSAATPTSVQLFRGTHKNFSRLDASTFFESDNISGAPQYYKTKVIWQDTGTHAICVPIADNFTTCQPDHVVRIAPSGAQISSSPYSPWIDFQSTSFTDSAGKSSTNCLEPGYNLNWESSARFSDDETSFGASFAGGPPWQASHSYTTGADQTVIIMPVNNNAGKWMFRITTLGTSGASEPIWSNFTSAGTTVNDGTVVWTALSTSQQDDALIMANWTIGKGCSVFDLGLLRVKRSDWQPVGPMTDGTGTCTRGVTCGNPASLPAGVTIHEGTQKPAPDLMQVDTHGCSSCVAPYKPMFIWEVGTLNLRGYNNNAHGAEGDRYDYLGHCYQRIDPYNPTSFTDYLFTFFFPENQHGGYQYRLSDGLDSTPVLMSSYRTTGAATNSGPWQEEVLGLRTDQAKGLQCSGSVNVNCANGVNCPFRFGQTYNSSSDADTGQNFVVQENFCTFSMNGWLAACTTDWMKTLGCTNGTASPCANSSLVRSDVILMDLRTAH